MNHSIAFIWSLLHFSRSCFRERLNSFVTFFELALFVLIAAFLAATSSADAHPMPNSLIVLDIHEHQITAELQLPLMELELAFGKILTVNTASAIATNRKELETYLLQHIAATTQSGKAHTVVIETIELQSTENAINGAYQELRVVVRITPPEGFASRDCIFKYDVILHQVVTHSALVSIRQDWDAGILADNPVEVGVIAWDIRTNTLSPLILNQEKGSLWQGCLRMLRLGMRHIAEGTDHLLFLIVLLLPSPLLLRDKEWGAFGGIKYSLMKVLIIVTSFTVGHSLTLIIGALGLVRLPSQPIEVLIALSIVVSSAHAIRPLFAKKEAFIAAGFGLVHGLAFASVLLNLHLSTGRMALSILGFNLGIEFMQLLVITGIMPLLIVCSRFRWYGVLRVTGAVVAGVLAIAWATERVTNQPNLITSFVGTIL
jgi:hypothetical protein